MIELLAAVLVYLVIEKMAVQMQAVGFMQQLFLTIASNQPRVGDFKASIRTVLLVTYTCICFKHVCFNFDDFFEFSHPPVATLIDYINYDAVLAFVVTFLPVVLLMFGTFYR